jgi:hypothetical protein
MWELGWFSRDKVDEQRAFGHMFFVAIGTDRPGVPTLPKIAGWRSMACSRENPCVKLTIWKMLAILSDDGVNILHACCASFIAPHICSYSMMTSYVWSMLTAGY